MIAMLARVCRVYLSYALALVARYVVWSSMACFLLSVNRVVNAQLLRYSMLHHITMEDLLFYNLTHLNTVEFRNVSSVGLP